MEGSKRIVIGAVLLIVIVIAAVFALKRAVVPPGAPQLKVMVQKIDMKTLDVITESQADWMGKYAANDDGFYKNPKTGTYTMVPTTTCTSCGQLIPDPFVVAKLGPPGRMPEAERDKFTSEAKCPKCGKNVFAPETAPPPPGPGGRR